MRKFDCGVTVTDQACATSLDASATPKSVPARALGYVRVSTKRQVDADAYLDRQEEQLKAHYACRGVDLVEIFRDCGLSGTTDHRPGLQAMIEHALRPTSEITEIGTCCLSRLARDHDSLERYRRQLKGAGVGIVAID